MKKVIKVTTLIGVIVACVLILFFVTYNSKEAEIRHHNRPKRSGKLISMVFAINIISFFCTNDLQLRHL